MHNSIKYSILCLSGKGIWNYEGVGDLKSKVVVGNSTEGEGREEGQGEWLRSIQSKTPEDGKKFAAKRILIGELK